MVRGIHWHGIFQISLLKIELATVIALISLPIYA